MKVKKTKKKGLGRKIVYYRYCTWGKGSNEQS